MSTTDDWGIHATQNTTQWLCTTASQIFFMQLGFLCYEVGFVKKVWTQSIILKNIEDTFVGILTFLIFGYTLSESKDSFYGIISIPTNPLLIGVPKHLHDQVLISAFFASTCATIISGGVLERMKNKAYITWCCLVILVNYSFVSHWVWHKDGWLNKLGFVDGAGAIVVHSTAGMGALIAVWKLGARKDSIDPYSVNDKLLKVEHATRPIINAIGAMFLWYGWFAFNVSSPIAFSKGIDDALGTTALVTVISPIASTGSAFAWMWFGIVDLSFESLLSCLLAGLISVTGICHTCNPWEAMFVGMCASIMYFIMSNTMRFKWKLDDPLQVIAIHLCCGILSGIAEGIVANDTYGTPGLIHGHGKMKSFKHFGVQILGVIVIVIFNFITCLFLWEIVLKRILFRTQTLRVSILDIYLGTRLFDQNYDMALGQVLQADSNSAKKMLFEFHQYISDRYASEQLDFLLSSTIFNKYLELKNDPKRFNVSMSAKYIIAIINNYIDDNGPSCINISGTQRSILLKVRKKLLFELETDQLETRVPDEGNTTEQKQQTSSAVANNVRSSIDQSVTVTVTNSSNLLPFKNGIEMAKENIFESVFTQVWKIVIPHFTQFLRSNYEESKKYSYQLQIPFKVNDDWSIQWVDSLQKDKHKKNKFLIEMVPQDTLALNALAVVKKNRHEYDLSNENRIDDKYYYMDSDNDTAIVFANKNDKKQTSDKSPGVIIE